MNENITIIDYNFSLEEYSKLKKFIKENFPDAVLFYLEGDYD